MIEMSFEYWNQLASQLILTSALLGGFSIAIVANLIISDSESRILRIMLKIATIASGCFLTSLFALQSIYMKTTEGYPFEVEASDITFPQNIGASSFMLGIVALCVILSLSGWTKSKRTGIFTTIIGVLTLIAILTVSSS